MNYSYKYILNKYNHISYETYITNIDNNIKHETNYIKTANVEISYFV